VVDNDSDDDSVPSLEEQGSLRDHNSSDEDDSSTPDLGTKAAFRQLQ
jgi:hypothetical protein